MTLSPAASPDPAGRLRDTESPEMSSATKRCCRRDTTRLLALTRPHAAHSIRACGVQAPTKLANAPDSPSTARGVGLPGVQQSMSGSGRLERGKRQAAGVL